MLKVGSRRIIILLDLSTAVGKTYSDRDGFREGKNLIEVKLKKFGTDGAFNSERIASGRCRSMRNEKKITEITNKRIEILEISVIIVVFSA